MLESSLVPARLVTAVICANFELVADGGKIFVQEVFDGRADELDRIDVTEPGWKERLRQRFPGRVDPSEVIRLRHALMN